MQLLFFKEKTDLEDCFQLPSSVFFFSVSKGVYTDGQILFMLGYLEKN